jgi:2-polyprenyl-3-methyl-5-hydroxy-6-metoxy-1,4-benzoquinol methylase
VVDRFAFGDNWRHFLDTVNDTRIERAEASLREMLGVTSLVGRRFLDIGSGSGLFSLAARRLGAEVHSFDFDPQSVACAEELKRRYRPGDPLWRIERGSVLDADYLRPLGRFDIVYSWGVLHHTGEMWKAIENAMQTVNAGGLLFIAIYNDQGVGSVWWARVKRTYNRLPWPLQIVYVTAFAAALEAAAVSLSLVRLQPRRILDRWCRYENVRGMSRWHDIVDWIGGYPFEVARPDAVVSFCADRGFSVRRLKDCGGRMGCNEFVFAKPQDAA